MRARDVSVSVTGDGGGLRVWNASFTLPVALPMKDGKVDESARRRFEKKIADAISAVDFKEL